MTSSASPSPLWSVRARSNTSPVVYGFVVVAALAVLAGLVLHWPDKSSQPSVLTSSAEIYKAKVMSSAPLECGFAHAGEILDPPRTILATDALAAASTEATCSGVMVELTAGEDAGTSVLLEIAATSTGSQGGIQVGDVIEVSSGVSPGDNNVRVYSYYDTVRGAPLLMWALIAVLVVAAVGALRGITAVVSLIIAATVVSLFTVPAIVAGSHAMVVAAITAGAIALLTTYLMYGFTHRSTVALAAVLATLGVATLLGWALTVSARLAIASSLREGLPSAASHTLFTPGILTAGVVVGTIGVLQFVATSQVETIVKLRRVNPLAAWHRVLRKAIRRGAQKFSSMVFVLSIAYAGVALPVFIAFSSQQRSLIDILSSEMLAIEMARFIVGSAALALIVPISSAITLAFFEAIEPIEVDPLVSLNPPKKTESEDLHVERLTDEDLHISETDDDPQLQQELQAASDETTQFISHLKSTSEFGKPIVPGRVEAVNDPDSPYRNAVHEPEQQVAPHNYQPQHLGPLSSGRHLAPEDTESHGLQVESAADVPHVQQHTVHAEETDRPLPADAVDDKPDSSAQPLQVNPQHLSNVTAASQLLSQAINRSSGAQIPTPQVPQPTEPEAKPVKLSPKPESTVELPAADVKSASTGTIPKIVVHTDTELSTHTAALYKRPQPRPAAESVPPVEQRSEHTPEPKSAPAPAQPGRQLTVKDLLQRRKQD